MSTNTTNYKLIKPDRTDNVLVENINYNTEIIDIELKKRETDITNITNDYVAKVDVATETTNGISKIATQPEVDAGSDDTKIVTSKKLKARLDSMLASITNNFVKLTRLATESIAGIIKISTTAQVSTGTDNTTAVSPAKLKELFVNGVNVSANGYEKLPNGLIRQWGYVSFSSVPTGAGNLSETTVYFPINFPNACRGVYITGNDVVGDDGLECVHSARSITLLGFVHRAARVYGTDGGSLPGSANWEAIGY